MSRWKSAAIDPPEKKSITSNLLEESKCGFANHRSARGHAFVQQLGPAACFRGTINKEWKRWNEVSPVFISARCSKVCVEASSRGFPPGFRGLFFPSPCVPACLRLNLEGRLAKLVTSGGKRGVSIWPSDMQEAVLLPPLCDLQG